MALLSKAAFISQSKAAMKPVTVDVPSGGQVSILRLTTGGIRKWRLFLRDGKGEFVKDRQDKAAELFLGRVMCGDAGRMFSDEEVLAGQLDDVLGEDVEYLTDVAYRLNGIGVTRPEVAAKNSETTDENEPSGE